MKMLLSEEQIRQGMAGIADEIGEHYTGRPLTIIRVMIGSVVLLADLIRRLCLPLWVELVQARSYRNDLPYVAALEPHEIDGGGTEDCP